ncbi:MAG: histidine kinase N-terminal domain-containing protein [Microthrixaceae bacterium]
MEADSSASRRLPAHLGSEATGHLTRLLSEWSMLADFCFSDLVLYVRDDDRFRMVRHVRPATSQTIYLTDIVGQTRTPMQRPLIAAAFGTGAIHRGTIDSAWLGETIRVEAIPVNLNGSPIAVLAREFVSAYRPHPGELEQTYETVFGRFTEMIADGTFPFPPEDVEHATVPRVGDGVIVVDADGLVEYSSPNANSTLNRSGVEVISRGSSLRDLGFFNVSMRAALATGRPSAEEREFPGDVTVALRVLPFIRNGVAEGAVMLVRDVTEVRHRDRLLLSKDATIAEIHHRVKNNLQTISSLLRLQGRRLSEPTARDAVEESVRRIHSIALVHETLSREPGDDVEFRSLLGPLVRMVNEGLVSSEHPIEFRISGDGGVVASEVATSLSLVVTELLQNAVEHAFVPERQPWHEPLVEIELARDDDDIVVTVIDNGVGWIPAAVRPARSSESLGQSIIAALVIDELRGTIDYRCGDDGSGTKVVISVSATKRWE